MHFMVIWTFKPEHRQETVARFMETGGRPPQGVSMLARWHDVAGARGFAVAEAADAVPIAQWCRQWADLLSFQVTPVIDDQQLQAILAG